MKIIHRPDEYGGAPCVLVMGMFDGLHIGHRQLIALALDRADTLGLPCVLLTYDRHPLTVISPGNAPKPIMTTEEKIAGIEKMGVDTALVIHFDEKTAGTPADAFLDEICSRLHPRIIAVGFNHSFGKGGAGGPDMLRANEAIYGYKTEVLDEVVRDGECVSSSRIRRLISEGRTDEANRLLDV